MNVSSLLLKLLDFRVQSDLVWVWCREYRLGAGHPWGRMASRVTPPLCSLASAFSVTNIYDRETHRPSRLPAPGRQSMGSRQTPVALSYFLSGHCRTEVARSLDSPTAVPGPTGPGCDLFLSLASPFSTTHSSEPSQRGF